MEEITRKIIKNKLRNGKTPSEILEMPLIKRNKITEKEINAIFETIFPKKVEIINKKLTKLTKKPKIEENLDKEKLKQLRIGRFDEMINILRSMKEEPKEFVMECLESAEVFQPIIKEITIYKEKELATSEEKRFYIKMWRERKKEEEKLTELEEKNQLKIKTALERKKGMCYKCQEVREVINPTYNIDIKRDGRKHIIIKSKCPICKQEIKQFGGKLS